MNKADGLTNYRKLFPSMGEHQVVEMDYWLVEMWVRLLRFLIFQERPEVQIFRYNLLILISRDSFLTFFLDVRAKQSLSIGCIWSFAKDSKVGLPMTFWQNNVIRFAFQNVSLVVDDSREGQRREDYLFAKKRVDLNLSQRKGRFTSEKN